ncbi:hypothetical protein ACFLSQ_10915 [Bacteroidota bacterium]
MKRILMYILIIFVAISCRDDKLTCPHCGNEDNNEENPVLKAGVSGMLNFNFESEEFYYKSYNYGNYILREITAKMYVDSFFVDILITFNDYYDGKKEYNFSNDNASAIFTVRTMPAEYYQHNVTGMINIINFDDINISATFDFEATTTNPENKIEVKSGVINYTAK